MSIYPIGGSVICDAGNYDAQGITTGPDGTLWFTNYGQASVGRMTTSGKTTIYPAGAFGPTSITTGPDGALWFTNTATVICCGDTLVATGGSIGRITTSGAVTTYPTGEGDPGAITVGPDGALWFTNGADSIGRITTSGAVTIYSGSGISYPTAITAGPDGALWFTGDNSVGRITTSGAVSIYSVSGASGIAAGPDGALWITSTTGQCVPVNKKQTECNSIDAIDRMTTSGVLTSSYSETPGPLTGPLAITAGPDGALWFTNYGLDPSIGRITSSGVISTYTDPSIKAPQDITTGPDGALWFVDPGASTLGRVATT